MADDRHSHEMSRWLKTVGNLLTFVDHLFNALIVPESIVSVSKAVVEVPVAVQQARAALDAARRERVD